ncbi:MAG: outer membrane protein assembly factor [Bacteroidales bacterium]|nr:outer membrane protein assembly factor [Bacteroidales bacterium]
MEDIFRFWALLVSGGTGSPLCFAAGAGKRCSSPFAPDSSRFLLHASLLVLLASCNPARHVPKGEYLLESVELKVDSKTVNREQLKSYIRQKPNKKIVWSRFHLWLYNSSKLDKKNKWNEWLRKNGEEPVIWQQDMTDRSMEQLASYLETKGYYYSEVTDTVILKKKKADVIYSISTGWPYTVNRTAYAIPDTAIARLILADTANSLIRRGILLDHDILKKERKRIEINLKNHGYYSFAEGFIDCSIDTTALDRKANVELVIKPHTELAANNQVVEAPYPLYYIRSLTVNASLSMQNLMESAGERKTASDTLKHGEVSFIIPQRFPVKASAIRNAIFIFPDSLYRISSVNQTYQHLNGLRNFKQITPEFTGHPGQVGSPERELDCVISLLPFTRQNYAVELEGTNSEGNLGGGVRYQYQNKSLFGHAEIFDLRLRGLVEVVATKETGVGAYEAKMEYEAEATLNVPKFLLPFRSSRFTQRYNPKTAFSILYNYQRYPEYYTRTVFSTSFGYNWRGSDVISHIVKPLDVNYVQLPDIGYDFQATLDRYPYLKNSYQPHMVVSGSYTYVKDMRPVNKDKAFFIRTSFETAGLLLDAVYRMSSRSKQPGQSYEMLGNQFSQFVKGDVDLRYYHTINGNQMVARLFAGVGWPYGNSRTAFAGDDDTEKTVAAMPFEKKYYVGGANSIRGWRLRSLGPGSYKDSASFTSYPNNTGDIKLEINLESRFKLVGLLEGALFMDAGNVWDSHRDEDRPGADFSFDRFYREIAVSGGIGFRFDFKYFILRSDVGMKLHDPAGKGRWAFTPKPDGSRRIDWDDFCLSISIGYPFF